MRIGHGFDVHKFGGDKPCILGGVLIEGHIGFIAHSDGDVLIHALCDALLGACALGDIGRLYPDTSEKFANIDSRILLRDTFDLIVKNGYRIVNIDITVLAQSPKISVYQQKMRENISQDLNLSINDISIKATTTEKLGFVGRKEGVAVEAVVLVDNI